MNITSLTQQQTSSNSRRSSSLSTIALHNTSITNILTNLNNPIHNNSTITNLYTRQYNQKKTIHHWQLIRSPLPLNPIYRKTLFFAIILPFIGALLFISSTLTADWEKVHFKFVKLLEMFSIKQNCSIFNNYENNNNKVYNLSIMNQTDYFLLLDNNNNNNNNKYEWNNNFHSNLNYDDNNDSYTLELIIFRDGKILNWQKLKNFYKNCLTITYKINEIIGIVIHSKLQITMNDNTSKQLIHDKTMPPPPPTTTTTTTRLFHQYGDLLDDINDDNEMNRNLWLIMNLQAGIWTMCFRLEELIIFRDGKILNWQKLKNFYKNCLTITYKINEIIGIVIHSKLQITMNDNTSKQLIHDKTMPPPPPTTTTTTTRLFHRNKYSFTRNEWIQLIEYGDLLDDINDDNEMNRNLWLIMNLQAGIWTMCFRLEDAYKPKILAYSSNMHPDSNIPLDCMSYLQANLSETKNLCIQFLLKMQNNIISCVVVVYLSVAASVLIGAFSTVFRAVPAAMVTGVLYVTSGVFIIFANCIHHTKLNRLEYEWGPCYPISQIPRTLYTPDIISVHTLWPVLVSWISSFVFFTASITWMILTQLMTFENSKTMI
ncbi:hypothetical protein MN116_007934 [Schistosoma mekongi]|uniref:Uncharacterized protein n=1 Tax=Schistosoma mekongi TaxID=38744 RepID=A0AAE2D3B9_SCHME|nr:hypothetical protein MN116_007934 [Schistosoma mekongi]